MLTRTQFKIYMLIVTRAMGERDIATMLNAKLSSVKRRTKEIFDVMGVSSRLELLIQYWYRELHPQEAH